MSHTHLRIQFLTLALFAWPTFAQQVSPAVGNPQVSGTPAAAAQVPRLIKFSGAVKDAGGKPVSSMAGITFALYEDQQGGTPLWTENQNVQPDAAGRYTVWLGATKNDGMPVELFASGQARWLGVQVEGQPEQARVLLAAVPYALKAADAETIGGLPPSAFLLAGVSAAGGHAVDSNLRLESAAGVTPAVGGSGAENYIPIWTDSAGDLGNSGLYQNGGNIGLGTTAAAIGFDIRPTATSPFAQLGVAQTVDYMTLFASDAYGPAFYWDPTKALRFGKGGTALYDPYGFVEYMRIQPNGYVGIGTKTPATTLEVNGTAQVDGNLTMKGLITFGSGQTFPGSGGSGTVTSVGSGAGLTGGPITTTGTLSIATGGVSNTMLANPSLTVSAGTDLTGGGAVALGGSTTLNLDTTKVPLLNAANTFTGNQTVNGNLSATGVVTGSSFGIGSNLFAFGSYSSQNAFLGFSGNTTTTGDGNTAAGFQALASNTTGTSNVAEGYEALQNNTTGGSNTATGSRALYFNTTGTANTASGLQALLSNTTGNNNTASGYEALEHNTTASGNTATGYQALFFNTTGSGNTASGYWALYANTTGYNNVADGYEALQANITGYDNTAIGYQALTANTTGSVNMASGYQALYSNTAGGASTAIGQGALYSNTTGWWNTAIGQNALYLNSTGSVNIAIGNQTGYNVTGSNNIDIGNLGTGSDSGTIRIGTVGTQTSAFIAGIFGVNANGIPVYINSSGQLGTVSSSRRYKEDIQDMGERSSGLMRLRPVTFRYKKPFDDGSKPVQFGLIAEEVAEVYPDLVAHSADGQIETVKYQVLDSMLLNELQKQNATIAAQKEEIRSLEERLARVEAALSGTTVTASR